MSIINELNRIVTAKVAIREKLSQQNIELDENYLIDELPNALDRITTPVYQGEGTMLLKQGNRFNEFSSIEYLPILDLTNIVNMASLFQNCYELRNLKYINYNKEQITHAHYAFYNCRKLNNFPEYDFPNAGDLRFVFAYCLNLTKVDTLHAPLAHNVGRSFQNCKNLRQIPTSISFPNALNAEYFFDDTAIITCPSVNLPKATHVSGMFYNCRRIANFSTDTYTFPEAQHLNYLFNFINTSNFAGEARDITLNAPKAVYLNSAFKDNACVRKVTINLGNEERPSTYSHRISVSDIVTNTPNLEEVIFDDCSQLKAPFINFNLCPKLRNIKLPNITCGVAINSNCTSVTKELILELFNNAQTPHSQGLRYWIPNRIFATLTQDEKNIIINKGYTLVGQ